MACFAQQHKLLGTSYSKDHLIKGREGRTGWDPKHVIPLGLWVLEPWRPNSSLW